MKFKSIRLSAIPNDEGKIEAFRKFVKVYDGGVRIAERSHVDCCPLHVEYSCHRDILRKPDLIMASSNGSYDRN